MSLEELVVLGACSLLAAVTQSVSGFGFGVVLVGLVPLFGIALRDAVVLIGIIVIPNLCLSLWRLRRHVSLRRVAWLFAGIPLGVPAGVWLQAQADTYEGAVRALLGSVLILAAAEPFLRRPARPRPARAWCAVATGALSGMLGAAFGTGGPPVVIYFYRRQWSKEATKASVMFTFVGTVAMRLVPYAWIGWITTRRLAIGAAVIPVVVLGTLMGEWLFGRVSQEAFRRVVAVMLVVLGLYQIGKAAGVW